MSEYSALLALMILVGLCTPVRAGEQCPDLARLRAEAAAASKQTLGVPTRDRCEAYTQLSIAWNDAVKYASSHREACDISVSTLNEIEKRHREAVTARDNVCMGRPLRPYPADVVLR